MLEGLGERGDLAAKIVRRRFTGIIGNQAPGDVRGIVNLHDLRGSMGESADEVVGLLGPLRPARDG